MRLPPNHWLTTTPIAHRGLWNERVAENSITAYQNAIDFGFAIEIDVYLSIDGQFFCFHDKNLKRVTGTNGLIYKKTAQELKTLNLCGGNEKMPTLKEVLYLCQGKAPLLIEIKNQPDKSVVKKLVDVLKDYKGQFAIQSFNPFYLKELKALAPFILRGILTTQDKEHLKEETALTKFVIKNMPFNTAIEPDFISCYHGSLPLKDKKVKNTAVLAWTVTSESIAKTLHPQAHNIIFENFTPAIKTPTF